MTDSYDVMTVLLYATGIAFILSVPRPRELRHNALITVVSLSVLCVILSREWKIIANSKLAEKAHELALSVTLFRGLKDEGQGH